MECLDDDRIFGLVMGTLPPEEVEAARAHLGACTSCRVLVAETGKSLEASTSLAEEMAETLLAASSGSEEQGGERALRPGDVVGEKYRIEETLGQGGMGTVFAAVHVRLKLEVAIKVLRTSMLSRRDVVARFMREARAAARIATPHVVRVLDVGELPTGQPFIVMDRLRGNDLSQELAQRGRLPVREAVDYAMEVCEAVAEAHATGVVHRDLKPANVFLCKAEGLPGQVKVLDFGISKISGRAGSVPDFSTEVQSWLGTPRYMAPEQITLGRKVDERADIWAIGTILYELISGHPPFQDKSLEVLCQRLLEGPAPSLAAESPDRLPRGLQGVVARCLEKQPDERYPSVGALARALAPFASPAKEVSLRRIAALPGMAPAPSERVLRRRASRPASTLLTMGLVVAGVLGVSSSLLWHTFASGARPFSGPPSGTETAVSTGAPASFAAEPEASANAPVLELRPMDPRPVTSAPGAGKRWAPRATSTTPALKHPEFGSRR